MNESVPDSPEDDELPDDEETGEQYRKAAEATLHRLMVYLEPFGKNLPLQTNIADVADPDLSAGALYSVPGSEPGTWQIIKVLVIDEIGVHVRLYANQFARRPVTVVTDILETSPFLSVAPEDMGHVWPLSVEHLPLMARTFIGMNPAYIAHTEVLEDELDGYREWKDAGGGYL